jgi:transcriptional regulator with XRE-family HTH domain
MTENNNNLLKTQIGKRFKELRRTLGLTQDQIAQRLGLTQTTITGIEKGKSFPTVSTILYLSENYRLSHKWLLSGCGNMREDPVDELPADYEEYEEEIKELLYFMRRVPMVRNFILENFAIYKIRNKADIIKWLENQKNLVDI